MREILLVSLILMMATPPAWSHGEGDTRNRVSLQVEARREVANDWATARLSIVAEGKEPSVVADSVNLRMKQALTAAKRAKHVEVESGAYISQPIYDDGRIVRWRARQELRLEAGDVQRLSKLIGSLQAESVLLSGIDFSVRPETRTAIEDELILEALAAFRGRATRIAQAMAAGGWSLIGLAVGRSNTSPRRVRGRVDAEMMSVASAAPPVFEAGSSDLRIQIDGTVELD